MSTYVIKKIENYKEVENIIFFNINNVNRYAIVDELEKTAACPHCENVETYRHDETTMYLSMKCKIENIQACLCNTCNNIVGFEEEQQEVAEEAISEFISNRPSISSLISPFHESSMRWCNSFACGCIGAANCSGQLSAYLYTKTDWIIWKSKNQNAAKNSFRIEINDFGKRIPTLKTLSSILHMPLTEMKSIIEEHPRIFFVKYDMYKWEEKDIQEDIEKVKKILSDNNILFDVEVSDMEFDEMVKFTDKPIFTVER
jgi:hypothetical protein